MITAHAGSITVGTTLLLACIAGPAVAQSSTTRIEHIRSPEAFIHTGVFRAGSDEGAIGSSISFGGAITVPLARRLAADVDIQTSRLDRPMGRADHVYETRRTLLVPSLFYRFGVRSVYGYVGGGIGAEFERSTYWRAGVVNERQSDLSRVLSIRGGVAGFALRRFGVRADVYTAGWHLGARVGIGYRFH